MTQMSDVITVYPRKLSMYDLLDDIGSTARKSTQSWDQEIPEVDPDAMPDAPAVRTAQLIPTERTRLPSQRQHKRSHALRWVDPNSVLMQWPPSKQSTTAFRKLSKFKILQTLLSLITNFPTIHDKLLANDGRAAVHAGRNTAPIPMLIVDKIVEEDRHMCPRFIQLRHFHKTFALEMIESVLPNYHQPTLPQVVLKSLSCSQHSELLPLLLERLSDRSTFPLALRGMHIVFHLLE
ncbi:hypothetical protein BGY98DRAFT_1104036 [Russula aff. rugulosa BPL654]|nr:hypothetical protein BGY98DRAFT_1104036 [Russula aff. rugulosa BPL654]